MSWKDWSNTKKGALIGFLFGFVLLIFILIYNFLLKISFLSSLFLNVFLIISMVPFYIFYFLLDLGSFVSRMSLGEGALGVLYLFMVFAPITYLIVGAIIGWIIDINSGNKSMPYISYWIKCGLIGVLISIFYILSWYISDNIPIIGNILHAIYYYIGFQWVQYITIIDIHPNVEGIILRILTYIGFFIFGALVGWIYRKIRSRSKK